VEKRDPNAEWWTTSDVAAYLGVGVGTVSTYRAREQMPAPDQTIGRTHVWQPARIIAWHESRPGRGGRPRKPVDDDAAGSDQHEGQPTRQKRRRHR
jgi:hypothetical protein